MKKIILSLLAIILASFAVPSPRAEAKAPMQIWGEADHASGSSFGMDHRLDGDLDGDGIKDLAISAPWWSGDTGRVYIYFGGASLSSSPDAIINGIGGHFGDGMATGDFNGDGFDDLAVGAVTYNSEDGKAYVFYGGSRAHWATITNANQANVKVTGEAGTIGHLGNKLGMGDINGDGRDDLLIGAEQCPHPLYDGRAYLLYGSTSTSIDINAAAADLIINNDMDGSGEMRTLGTEVDIADVGGDSHKDLLIAADDYNGSDDNGHAFVIFGRAAPYGGTKNISTSDVIIAAGSYNCDFSYPMRGGDVNGDGKKDLIVGCDDVAFHPPIVGSHLFVFFGGSSLVGNLDAAEADIIIDNEHSGQDFSMAIACGDFNRDGIDDIVTTAYSYGAPIRGRVYVFFGGPTLYSKTSAAQADYIIDNPYNLLQLTWWLSAGDINHDGWDEFGAGAGKVPGTSAVFIYSLSHLAPSVTIDSITGVVTVNVRGNATDPDGGNIKNVSYSLDGGSWQNADAADRSFDSSSEDYYFDLVGLDGGSHQVRVRATDTENATTAEANYATSNFSVIVILPESGQKLINYINNLLI